MEFALTLEVSELIGENGVSDYIKEVSNHISAFLDDRDYGDDLKTIYIGIICVAPEFDFFFKVRKPKYKKGTIVTIEDGCPYKQTDSLVYDVKLDYGKFVEASEEEVKRMLSVDLLNSFVVFNYIKIKLFDRERFEADIAICLGLFLR